MIEDYYPVSIVAMSFSSSGLVWTCILNSLGASGDPKNFVEFDAEIELTLDGKVNSITYPSWIFIPKGLMHCLLYVKRVDKPIIFIDARIIKDESDGPDPEH